jgi:hypothetical protein
MGWGRGANCTREDTGFRVQGFMVSGINKMLALKMTRELCRPPALFENDEGASLTTRSSPLILTPFKTSLKPLPAPLQLDFTPSSFYPLTHMHVHTHAHTRTRKHTQVQGSHVLSCQMPPASKPQPLSFVICHPLPPTPITYRCVYVYV